MSKSETYKRAAYTLRMMKRTAFPSTDEIAALDVAVSVLERLAERGEVLQ